MGTGLVVLALLALLGVTASVSVGIAHERRRAAEEALDAGSPLRLMPFVRSLVRSCRPLRVRRLPDEPRLEDVALDGRLRSGRAASIRFLGEPPRGRVAVHAVAGPALEVRRESSATRLAKRLGRLSELVIGVKPFDDRYLLLTEDVRAARRALRGEELRQAIDRAMKAHPIERLELDGEDLVAVVDATRVPPGGYARLLDTLDLVADVLQRQRVPVKLLGGERAAVVDPGGAMRCVFCLDAVRADDPGLSACTACRTVVHEACWTEHGGCPLYGCRGGERERARP